MAAAHHLGPESSVAMVLIYKKQPAITSRATSEVAREVSGKKFIWIP
jgi:hypothetical protein